MKFSIIVPVLNEKEIINETLESLFKFRDNFDTEIIVVDESRLAETLDIVPQGVIKMTARKGRATQMNRGAEVAKGDVLLFLHADTKLPPCALEKIETAFQKNNYVAGAFSLKIDSDNILLKITSFTANIRTYFTRVPYGDQAIFIRREIFKKMGGFMEIPIMEDVDLMKRIRMMKRRIIILKEKVCTSPRRWYKNGIVFTIFKHLFLRILYFLGVPAHKLIKFYT